MIEINVDVSGVIKAVDGLVRNLNETDTLGRVIEYAMHSIWIPNIHNRLFESTSKYHYGEFGQTMRDLDPMFVERLGDGSWADLTEAERRVPGGYKPGEITDKIANALNRTSLIKVEDAISVGLGSVDELDSLFPNIDEVSQHKIWEILNYGTGLYVPGGSTIIRDRRQIFYNRATGSGVLAKRTENPGFRGREYIVKVDNTFHESDYEVREYVIKHMRKIVRRFSRK